MTTGGVSLGRVPVGSGDQVLPEDPCINLGDAGTDGVDAVEGPAVDDQSVGETLAEGRTGPAPDRHRDAVCAAEADQRGDIPCRAGQQHRTRPARSDVAQVGGVRLPGSLVDQEITLQGGYGGERPGLFTRRALPGRDPESLDRIESRDFGIPRGIRANHFSFS
ncbi:hypothetical protein GCM10020221_18910 [Streptomyces thioluteus]|uniref:Uncharacterized protein n=1 Tax=Streptomyces thioluteus TaxID=66431 RepID=A0ABN3WNP9_STRTU